MSHTKLTHLHSIENLPAEFASNPNTAMAVSAQLATELNKAGASWLSQEPKLVNADMLVDVEKRVLKEMDALENPYHNGNHTREVMHRVTTYTTNSRHFSDTETLLARVAALFHDYKHPGTGIRQLVIDEPYSSEEYSALLFDAQFGHLLTLRERLVAQGLILATSFGQGDKTKLASEDLYREYTPYTNLEQVFQFSDVAGVDASPKQFLTNGLAVSAEIAGVGNPLPPVEDFLKAQSGFNGYVSMRLAEVSKLLSTEDHDRIAKKLSESSAEFELMNDGSGAWLEIVEQLYETAALSGIRL